MVRQPLPSSSPSAKTSSQQSEIMIIPHVGDSLDPSYTEAEHFDTTIIESLDKSDLDHGYKVVTMTKPLVVPTSALVARNSRRITNSASLARLKRCGWTGNSKAQDVLSASNKGHLCYERPDDVESRQQTMKASSPEHSITKSSFIVAGTYAATNDGYQEHPDFNNVDITLYKAVAVSDTKNDAPLYLMPNTAREISLPISKTINPNTPTKIPTLEELEQPFVQAFSLTSQKDLPSSMKTETAIEISVIKQDATTTSGYREPASRVFQKSIAPRDSDVYEKITAAVERQLSFAAKAQNSMTELVHPALDIVPKRKIRPSRTRSHVFEVVRAIEEKSARVDPAPFKSRRSRGQYDKVERWPSGPCTDAISSFEKRHNENVAANFNKDKEVPLSRTATVADDLTNQWTERTTHIYDVLTAPSYRRRSIATSIQTSKFTMAPIDRHDESVVNSTSSAVISTLADPSDTGVPILINQQHLMSKKASEDYHGQSTMPMSASPTGNLFDAYGSPENIIQIAATPYIHHIGSRIASISSHQQDTARKALDYQGRRNSWPISHEAQNIGCDNNLQPRHRRHGCVAPMIHPRSFNDSNVASDTSYEGLYRGVMVRESQPKVESTKASTAVPASGERDNGFSTSRCSAVNKDFYVGYTSCNPASRRCTCTRSILHNSGAHESPRSERIHVLEEAVRVEKTQERVRNVAKVFKEATKNSPKAEKQADVKVSKSESTKECGALRRPRSLLAIKKESRSRERCNSLGKSDHHCRTGLPEVHKHNNQVHVFLTPDADKSESNGAELPKTDLKGAAIAVLAGRKLEWATEQALSELDTPRSIPGKEHKMSRESRIGTQISPHRRDWSQYPLCARARSRSPIKQIRDVRDETLTRKYRRAISPVEKSLSYAKSRPMRNREQQSRRDDELEGGQNKEHLRGRSGLRGVFSYFIEVALGVDVETE